jgi:hypothetical protein
MVEDGDMAQRKNPHAVALRKLAGSKPGKARAANLTAKQLSAIGRKGGKAGGKKGGEARAAALTLERRKEIAQKAAAARWKGK